MVIFAVSITLIYKGTFIGLIKLKQQFYRTEPIQIVFHNGTVVYYIYRIQLIIMKKFEEIKQLIANAEKDAAAFYEKNNRAAGTRLRKVMQDVKVAATGLRKEVTEKKHA